jgi:hypothetical protein
MELARLAIHGERDGRNTLFHAPTIRPLTAAQFDLAQHRPAKGAAS